MYSYSALDIIKSGISTIALLLQYVLLPFCVYQFIVSIFGWVKKKEPSAENYKPVNKFAILVAAHNEEAVVANIVKNLNSLDYPRELYDVFVIADNCTDGTAQVAREAGAIVYERFDNVKKGKGYALEWMFAHLFKMEKNYDAISIFDADNLVSANFLKEMNKHMCMGHKVVQGYLDSKNPKDTLVSGSNSITFWLNNRLYQLARYNAGLCCPIGGTGFIVATELIKEYGWDATCLTEDLEFTLKLVLKGMKVYWSHDVVVYDEKPLTLKQSWKQRKRWMQGHCDCACRLFVPLLKKGIREKDLVALDSSIYAIQPLIMVLCGTGMIINILRSIAFLDVSRLFQPESIWAFLLLIVTTYIGVVFVIIDKKFSLKIAWYFILLPFYNLTWIPITIQGFLDRNNTEWSHTLHTRAIDITELKELERA